MSTHSKNLSEPGMVVYNYYPSTQEAEAEVPGQPGLHSKTVSHKKKKKKCLIVR